VLAEQAEREAIRQGKLWPASRDVPRSRCVVVPQYLWVLMIGAALLGSYSSGWGTSRSREARGAAPFVLKDLWTERATVPASATARQPFRPGLLAHPWDTF
jgi:hypothetical protein